MTAEPQPVGTPQPTSAATSSDPTPVSHTWEPAGAALNHLTRSLVVEWARFGIQVNALGSQYLTQGVIDMNGEGIMTLLRGSTPAGRTAHLDEVVAWGVILAGPLSDYVTGAKIPLDGGNHVGPGIAFRDSPILPETS
ncbi:MAG: SDR family oxidoreductase [Propionibacteriales bacterium]|nr:SDR family oxidoreductase [Propionibacteriales bacterium]MPZ67692.1 SDR family oxidoreductase [Pseudonocardiaceae bacterium]